MSDSNYWEMRRRMESELWLSQANGHQLIVDEEGFVDFWIHGVGYHNGPGCAACHESWCEHCHPDGPPTSCDAVLDIEAVVVQEDERKLIA